MFRISEIIGFTLIALVFVLSIYVMLLRLRDKRLFNLLMAHERTAIAFLIVVLIATPFGVSLIFRGRILSSEIAVIYILALFFSIFAALTLNEAWKIGEDLVDLRHRWNARHSVELVSPDPRRLAEVAWLVEGENILESFNHKDYLEISRLLSMGLSGGRLPMKMLVKGYEKLFMSPLCGPTLAEKLFQSLNDYQPEKHITYSLRLVEVMSLQEIAANLNRLGSHYGEILLRDLHDLGIATVRADVRLIPEVFYSDAVSTDWDDLSYEAETEAYYLEVHKTSKKFSIDPEFSLPSDIIVETIYTSSMSVREMHNWVLNLQAP